jgi:hypothetical protein
MIETLKYLVFNTHIDVLQIAIFCLVNMLGGRVKNRRWMA